MGSDVRVASVSRSCVYERYDISIATDCDEAAKLQNVCQKTYATAALLGHVS